MNETEIERLVVRLTGDGSMYQKMLQDAVKQTAQHIGEMTSTIKEFAITALGVLGSLGIAGTFSAMFSKFEDFEKNQIKMRAAIESNRHAVDDVLPRYKQFAAEVEAVSTVSKGEVMALLRQAETLGLSGQRAEEATKAAIGLAQAGEMSRDAALEMVAAVQKGNVHVLQRILKMRGEHDASKILAEAQRRIAIGLKTEAELSKTTGNQIERLKRSFGEITREMGKYVDKALRPVITGMQQAVAWFKALGPQAQEIAALVVMLSVAVLSMGPAWSTVKAVAGPSLSLIMGLLGFIMTPIGLITAGIVALGAAFLVFDENGGIRSLEEMWNILETTAKSVLAWLMPVITELGGLLSDIWDMATEALSGFWEFVTDTWKSIFGNTGEIWGSIQEYIVNAIMFARFTFKNFGQVAQFVWTAIAYGAVKFFNETIYFFGTVLPTYITWFIDNWKEIFETAWSLATNFFTNLASNIGAIFSNIGDIITGRMSIADLWTPLTQGFTNTIRGMPVVARREIGAIEADLRNEYERLGAQLGESFEEFRARRIREIQAQNGPEGRGRGEPSPLMADIAAQAKNATNEINKFDAALTGSAEAASRIAAYQESLNPSTAVNAIGAGGVLGTAPGSAAVAAAGGSSLPTGSDPWKGNVLQLLGRIASASESYATETAGL